MTAAKVTISDVAREAGVAQSTVSLVLNKRDHVSEATRRRIQQVMDRLGYTPRPNSSRPRRRVAILHGQSMMFCQALVGYCREWIIGIREGLGDKGGGVSVFSGAAHVSKDFMFEACLTAGDLDGLIVIGVHPYDGYLQRAVETGLPVVAINRLPRKAEFSSVCLDHDAIGRIAADHLAELGHRRVGLFLSKCDAYPNSALYAGFRDRLQEHEMDLALHRQDPELTFEDLARFACHAQSFAAAGVTAVLAGDPAAYRLANALENMGVSVPEQVSIVGIDNLGLKTDAGRRLSSIDSDKRGMGRLAGRMLQDLLMDEGGVTNLTANVPAWLYRGQTTGPCRHSDAWRSGDALARSSRVQKSTATGGRSQAAAKLPLAGHVSDEVVTLSSAGS